MKLYDVLSNIYKKLHKLDNESAQSVKQIPRIDHDGQYNPADTLVELKSMLTTAIEELTPFQKTFFLPIGTTVYALCNEIGLETFITPSISGGRERVGVAVFNAVGCVDDKYIPLVTKIDTSSSTYGLSFEYFDGTEYQSYNESVCGSVTLCQYINLLE